MRVLVTGGSGKLGRACVRDLVEHGHDILNADLAPPPEALSPFVKVNFEDPGEAIEAVGGNDRHAPVDAVVHLEAIPGAGRMSNPITFRINTLCTYNVFDACRRAGVKNVVWASSETLLGLPFTVPPPYLPVDELYEPRPETTYSLTKVLGEEMARQFCRWDSELKIVGLRFSLVIDEPDYRRFAVFAENPLMQRRNLWAYVNARDGAQAVRKSLEADIKGAEVFIIANEETVVSVPTDELVAACYPDVPRSKEFGPNESLLSSDKARRMLGYAPMYHWVEEVKRLASRES